MFASPVPFAVAHVRASEKGGDAPVCQPLAEHLFAVSRLTETFAAKAGLTQAGKLAGLLHDFGKYSDEFQRYILSSCGLIPPDSSDYCDPASHKGKIDHSSAGAQKVWEYFARTPKAKPYAQMLALCMASHHTGLLDCLSPEGVSDLKNRMDKADAKTHRTACEKMADAAIQEAGDPRRNGGAVMGETHRAVLNLRKRVNSHLPAGSSSSVAFDSVGNANSVDFQQGLLVRFLFSCLLDADRIDSACFDDPEWARRRELLPRRPWDLLVSRLEEHLRGFDQKTEMDTLRGRVSEQCARRATDPRGLFTLTVPTGGGKTLASLRFAMCHAQIHDLDRVIFVIPYTSIIDQNARVTREILEKDEEPGSIVLEHHSNLLPENDTRLNRLLGDNWEAPVVFTTMVQFLESLFGGGTGSARRMHNLAHSVVIFDEVQTLPVRCTHMFCHALDFLVETCGSSAVLCSATQPCLDRVPQPFRGSLRLTPEREIMDDVPGLFARLKRTDFFDHCDTPMTVENVAELALTEQKLTGSCLVVCNTKSVAEQVYALCAAQGEGVRYLSTNLCPAHRLEKLDAMMAELDDGKPVLCVSTQLIECGVDVSFGSAIRLAAGLDSILQTAGRCNRHGKKATGRVHIVRLRDGEENLNKLRDIAEGRRVFLDMRGIYARELASGCDYTRPDIIDAYFESSLFQQGDVMCYRVKNDAREDTLLSMLGSNANVAGSHSDCLFRQSFESAAKLFHAIDSPARAVIVPYGKGVDIIAELCSSSLLYRKRELLREAQRYSVNVFPQKKLALESVGALYNIQDSDIFALREAYYSSELGVVTRPEGNMTTCYFG